MALDSTQRYFFRHLRDGKGLREHPLTLLAVGTLAAVLPRPLLVRAIHDRLRILLEQICARRPLASKIDRARRLRHVFERHIVGGEHWSTLASELEVSRRQFFRERKLLCDELSASLQTGTFAVPSEPPHLTRGELAYNEAYLAFEAGRPDEARRILDDLCVFAPAGDLRSRAFLLAADCAIDELRFEEAASNCALASNDAGHLSTPDDRTVAMARVGVTRSRLYLHTSDYRRAHTHIASAQRSLSRLSRSDFGRTEVMNAISVRAAEVAIHVGAFDVAVEHVRRLSLANVAHDGATDFAFDLASLNAATEAFAGRFQSALLLLEDAFVRAERLKFNRQVVRHFIERAWIANHMHDRRHAILASKVAEAAESIQLPYLRLEGWLFSASNAAPDSALDYAVKARRASPPRSMLAARAIYAQALASYDLDRFDDAYGLASEMERLSDELDNNRMRSWALALMARSRFALGEPKEAIALKRDADELLRLYASTAERRRFALWTSPET